MALHVNVDNFARAETARMFRDIQRDAGSVNSFHHARVPAPIDAQTVIRLNRDTLYSFAIVNVTGHATLTLPESGERYVSAMVVDEDHFVRAVLHEPGEHDLSAHTVGTDFVLVAIRTLCDPNDAADLDDVAEVQNAIELSVSADAAYEGDDYDTASLDATRRALLALAEGLHGFDHMFGAQGEVDPVRHLIGSAAGWGGLPTSEATYVGVAPQLAPTDMDLRLDEMPIEAFWSVSVYNARGFFEPNDAGLYTVNSVTAVPDADGAVTVRFRVVDAGEPNTIIVPEGWNLLVRLYRPTAAAFDGSWELPELVAAA